MTRAELVCPLDPSHQFGTGSATFQCPVCSTELEVRVPLGRSFRQIVADGRGAIWRYAELIPVNFDERLEDAVQPKVVRSAQLERRLGVEAVWLLDATGLGTGNFKDYEASVLAAASKDAGLQSISVHSTGNTAGAYRHYAERIGLPCASFIPLENLNKLGNVVGSENFPIYAIDAPYPAVSSIAKRAAADGGWHHMAPLRWKLQGKAAIAWQIAEYCGDVDVIVQTVAGGYGPLGMEEGFNRIAPISEESVTSRRRYLMYQPSDADGLGRAWRSGRDSTSVDDLALPSDPYEPTLQSTNPVATLPELRRGLPAESEIHSVDIGLIEGDMEAALDVCNELGIIVDPVREKSALISLVGLMHSSLPASSRVVVVISGSGPFAGSGGVRGWQTLQP